MRPGLLLLFGRFHGYELAPPGVPERENEAQEPPAPLLSARYLPDPSALLWDPGLRRWAGLLWKRVRGPREQRAPRMGDPCGTGRRALLYIVSSLVQILDSKL